MTLTGDWDRRISRRTLLRTGGTLTAGVLLSTTAGRALAAMPTGDHPFTLGVASGDPTPDGVVLWTRLAPDPLRADGGLPAEAYGVRYEVAADEGFRRIVRRGAVEAVPEEAHSVHVELAGMPSGAELFYRFKVGTAVSPVGRTRTAPAAGAAVERLRFAFASCQNYPVGYFNAYADVAADEDLDLVIHLGDYVYEGSGQGPVRGHAPAKEVMDLADYRIRHAVYKGDQDLQAAHAAHPWYVTWDDHEVDNNYADLEQDPDATLAAFTARRTAAYRAYWEHMPLRRARKPTGKDLPLFRRFSWGSLAELHVLDTRQHRSDQPRPGTRDALGFLPDATDPSRTMLGAAQRSWLLEGLASHDARWNVLANQTAFAPFDRNPDPAVRDAGEGDNWDGYDAERQELIDHIVSRGVRNPVVITGDSHQNWIRNVPPSAAQLDGTPVATEFMGTSITSGGNPATRTTSYGGDPDNPHIVFRNNERGYVRCTLRPESWTSDFRRVLDVTRRGQPVDTVATFVVEDGRPGAVRA